MFEILYYICGFLHWLWGWLFSENFYSFIIASSTLALVAVSALALSAWKKQKRFEYAEKYYNSVYEMFFQIFHNLKEAIIKDIIQKASLKISNSGGNNYSDLKISNSGGNNYSDKIIQNIEKEMKSLIDMKLIFPNLIDDCDAFSNSLIVIYEKTNEIDKKILLLHHKKEILKFSKESIQEIEIIFSNESNVMINLQKSHHNITGYLKRIMYTGLK